MLARTRLTWSRTTSGNGRGEVDGKCGDLPDEGRDVSWPGERQALLQVSAHTAMPQRRSSASPAEDLEAMPAPPGRAAS